MAEHVPVTLVVEDSQNAEYHPDNQLGLEDSQPQGSPCEVPLTQTQAVEIEETPRTETGGDTKAVDVNGLTETEGQEGKVNKTEAGENKEKETEVVESKELADREFKDDSAERRELEKFPETMAYQNGSQGPIPEQIVRQDAFLEEDHDQMLEAEMMKCKKCGLEVELTDSVIRGPTELWCKECNSLYTMLRRHQAWPPSCFSSLSDEAQQSFFARCKQEKEEAKKTMFSYKTVRDTLVTNICEATKKVKSVGVGGTYLPLSVYRQRGYEIDQGFTQRNPSQWSPGLNAYTYLLVESSISEKEIRESTEMQVLQAERSVRKRKAADMVRDEEDDKKSTCTAGTVVLDLVTESEAEGHCDSFFCAKVSPLH